METPTSKKTNYRELQGIAKELHLPGNLKVSGLGLFLD